MNKILMSSALALCLAAATASHAQPPRGGRGDSQPQQQFREDGLDPSPVGAATDPISTDLWVGDYRNSKPRAEYGALSVRDILTDLAGSDRLRPAKRGAVLETMHNISYATLAPGASASGKAPAGDRQVFYTAGGAGTITVNGKAHALKDGTGFTLTPDFSFKLTNTGKTPMNFYIRAELLPGDFKATNDIVVVDRFDSDRRIGAHWVHICNGGPNGMSLCTIAPYSMPQPHSHPNEEAWIMVKGETMLSLGKDMRKMIPGQAYRIPPTGLAAHSNINLSEEPVQMLYLGVAVRPSNPPPGRDFARLDNAAIKLNADVDIDQYMGNWRDALPRIVHGNLYFRDMLTALQGPDALHPARRGAVLTSTDAVSYAMLEPNAVAHRIDGELKGIQETFIVNSGAGYITQGAKRFDLSKDKAFIITPGMDFKMTATGSRYLTFYVVSEKIPEGASPSTTLNVVDNSKAVQTTANWYDKERPLIARKDGLLQFDAINQVQLDPTHMDRPYSAAKDVEEIWIATEGDVDMLFGKTLRKLPAGTAYRIPSTGITARANMNFTAKPAMFLTMVK